MYAEIMHSVPETGVQAENPAALPSVELRHGCRLCRIYGIHASFVGLQTGNDLLSLRKICS